MGAREGSRRPKEAPISDGVWAILSRKFRRWVVGIWQELQKVRRELQDLKAEVHELKLRLGQNSTNSSRSPSTDPPGTKKAKDGKRQGKPGSRRGRKRRPGGQPGHEGHRRPLVPPEEVDKREELRPEHCGKCHRELQKSLPTVEDPRLHQIVEIPEIVRSILEYVLHGIECPDCGVVTFAKLPEGVSSSNFGVNLRALVALLSGKYRISRRQAAEFCRDVLGIQISVGAIDNVCSRASDALKAPVEEVAERVKQASVAYIDETSWREKGKLLWLWVVVTTEAVLFHIGTRCKKEATHLLGANFLGSLVSDRYGAYIQFAAEWRQVCWAHLARDFKALVDRGGAARRFGLEAIKLKNQLFKVWRRYKAGKIRWDAMQRQMRGIEISLGALLQKGLSCTDKRAASLCKSLQTVEPALFHFARVKGVEPTNNTAEQTLRPAVLWRKTCFGTQSARGSRFVARMMTVTMTCRVQGRSVFHYLRSVIQAHDRGGPIPSLFGGQRQACGSDAA